MEIMGRSRLKLPDGCSFHITLRCNSRAFLIARGVRRDLLLPVLRKGFHDPYSNYGHYEGLVGDGLSEWHPAFLQLAPTLEGCARRYAHYCRHYRPQAKPARKSGWGSRLLQLDGGGSTAAAVGWRRGGSAAAGRMATAGGDIPQGQRGQGKQLGLDQRCHKWLQREEKKGGLRWGEFGALEIRNQREQAVRAAVAWRRRTCKSMAPLQRGRGDHRWAEGARYRSARWTSGRSGSGDFDAVPQLAAEAEGGGSTEEGQGAWDGRRWWLGRLDRSECNEAKFPQPTPHNQEVPHLLRIHKQTRENQSCPTANLRPVPIRIRQFTRSRNEKPRTNTLRVGAIGIGNRRRLVDRHNANSCSIASVQCASDKVLYEARHTGKREVEVES